ncbi:hypothetical protein DM860_009133 [Cuscuta australis]|uniref:Uncharacterized protein n=2 Tax=Cuscuta sect. Cleistogrammica TaxID=1824901 RepID=A0A328DCD0_9ASTE|nr:hypothetical protein DM860_009133 [Cuscuta australis]
MNLPPSLSAQTLQIPCFFFHSHGCSNSHSKLFSSIPATPAAAHRPPRSRSSIRDDLERSNYKCATAYDEGESERSETDKLVDGMDFGELCNEFECFSSPSVEATARLLVRDILELRDDSRSFATYAISVQYKDPVRNITGREKYKRPLWVKDAMENPTSNVQEMVMLSTSVLNIKWTVKGKPKPALAATIGGDLTIKVDSKFTLNQISGQVIGYEELWDLSASSIIAQTCFLMSRRLSASIEAGKDTFDFVKDFTRRFTTENESMEVDPESSGDPTKFFLWDDQGGDLYQIALFLALVYFVVQVLRTTL